MPGLPRHFQNNDAADIAVFFIPQAVMPGIVGRNPRRGCVKRFLPPAAAKFYFKTDVFFMILRSKIMKNTSVLNFNLERSAGVS
jgi:hypothetical protein